MPKTTTSCDIADYHMGLTDAQAIAELQKMGIEFPVKG